MGDAARGAPRNVVVGIPPRVVSGAVSADAVRSAPRNVVAGIPPRAVAVGFQAAGPSAQNASLEAQVAAAQSEVNALTYEVGTIQAALSGAGASASALQSQYGAVEAQIVSAQGALGTLQSELSGLAGSLAAATVAGAALASEVAELTSEYQALVATLTADVSAVIPSLQAQSASLQQQVTQLDYDIAYNQIYTIPPLQQAYSEYGSLIAAATVQALSLEAQVDSYNAVGAAVPPSLATGPNETDEDYPGGPNDPGYGPYDSAYSGFAPYAAGFSGGSPGLVVGGGSSSHAVRAQVSGGLGILSGTGPLRSLLAAILSRAPPAGAAPGGAAAQTASLQAQLAALDVQIGTLQTVASGLTGSLQSAQSDAQYWQGQVGAATLALSGLQGQVAAASAGVAGAQSALAAQSISGLEAQATQLQTEVAALGSGPVSLSGTPANLPSANAEIATLLAGIGSLQSPSNPYGVPNLQAIYGSQQALIAALKPYENASSWYASVEAQVTEYSQYLSAIQAGTLPVSFSWNYGDGTSGPGAAPSHTYGSPGSFSPSVTATVRRPDGAAFSRTFSLPGLLIGQWPAAINVGPTSYSGSNAIFTTTVVDGQGNPIANTRVLAHLDLWVDYVHATDKDLQAAETDASGQISWTVGLGAVAADLSVLGYGWKVTLLSLRNPTVTNSDAAGYTG